MTVFNLLVHDEDSVDEAHANSPEAVATLAERILGEDGDRTVVLERVEGVEEAER